MFFENDIVMDAESTVSESGTTSVESTTDSGSGSSFNIGNYSSIIILVVFIAVFYFLLIRPEKKRNKAAQDMRSSVKVGDSVVTIGGISGEVDKVSDDSVTVFTGDCSIVVEKWAIRSVEPAPATEENYVEDESDDEPDTDKVDDKKDDKAE